MFDLSTENFRRILATLMELYARNEALKNALIKNGLLTEEELLDSGADVFAHMDQDALRSLEFLRHLALQTDENPKRQES